MTKKTQRNGTATTSAAAIAAVLLAVPSSASAQQNKPGPSTQSSQRTSADAKEPAKKIYLDFANSNTEYKFYGEYWVAGDTRRHSVFEDARGNLFYVDSATGDQKFLVRKAGTKQLEYLKLSGKVRIVGVDGGGNVIMKNAKGENFYINPENGDFIFVHNVVGR